MKKVSFLWTGLQSLRGSMWIRRCGYSSVIKGICYALGAAPHLCFFLLGLRPLLNKLPVVAEDSQNMLRQSLILYRLISP